MTRTYKASDLVLREHLSVLHGFLSGYLHDDDVRESLLIRVEAALDREEEMRDRLYDLIEAAPSESKKARETLRQAVMEAFGVTENDMAVLNLDGYEEASREAETSRQAHVDVLRIQQERWSDRFSAVWDEFRAVFGRDPGEQDYAWLADRMNTGA